MSLYLDASVLVALITQDALTTRAEDLLCNPAAVPIVSDFAAAEFASVLARRVRTGDLTRRQARGAFATLDAWRAQGIGTAVTDPVDIAVAEAWMRRLDTTLRTPDAVNLAIAMRLDATVATFDMKMATAARGLGLSVMT